MSLISVILVTIYAVIVLIKLNTKADQDLSNSISSIGGFGSSIYFISNCLMSVINKRFYFNSLIKQLYMQRK
jgi:hypothetical protein